MKRYLKLYSKKIISNRKKEYQTNITELRKTIKDNEEYFIFTCDSYFCFEEKEIDKTKDLSEYEWEGNEYYKCSNAFHHKALIEALFFMISLKRELTWKYKKTNFTIVLIKKKSVVFFLNCLMNLLRLDFIKIDLIVLNFQ